MNFQYSSKHYLYSLYINLGAFFLGVGLIVGGYVAWQWILLTWFIYFITVTLNSAGFHRLFSHQSYQTSTFWEIFLTLYGTLTMYGSSINWSIYHTAHHRYSDTEKDPHQFKQIKDVFFNSYRYDKAEFTDKKVAARLSRKWYHRITHKYYWLFPLSFATILFLINPLWLIYGYMAPVGLTIFGGAFFNYFAHTVDGPQNHFSWTLALSGENRHQLHHDEPWRWDFREKWYHIDLAAMFIKLIKKND